MIAPVIRTVLVDDDPPALDQLHQLLAPHPDIQIVGRAGDGKSAVEIIDRERPDLVFMGVQIPGIDGFAVLEQLAARPAVVFVTANECHAVRAFEHHALDFLLKPYDERRIGKTLDRVRAHAAQRSPGGTLDHRLVSFIEELRAARSYPERLIVRSNGRVFFVRPGEVDWVEAQGNYVRIHANSEAHVLRESMKNMEAKLDPKTFVRIHRSAIVTIDRVKELEPWFHGEYIVHMQNGAKLTASRVFSDRLSAIMA